MNTSLYNKIINSVSKIVKKSINEAYNISIYDRHISFDELSILNHSGNIGDILQVNQYGDQYRVKSGNLDINESMFDDIDFDDIADDKEQEEQHIKTIIKKDIRRMSF